MTSPRTSIAFWKRNPAEVCKVKLGGEMLKSGRANLSREDGGDENKINDKQIITKEDSARHGTIA